MTNKTIAYLGCKYCLPGSPERRSDAYEHDREMDAFKPAFGRAGLELVDVDWEALDTEAKRFDLFLVRTTWNYVEKPQAFMRILRNLAQHAPVFNDPDLIEWNMSKRYLQEFEQAGLPVIRSVFVEDDKTTLDSLREKLGCSDLVLKPVYGGGGFGQRLSTEKDEGNEIVSEGVFAQPFIPDITRNGEISYIFVNGAFSHCVRKVPADGEYLIHSYHGGAELPYSPSPAEIAEARGFLAALPYQALATRVDLVPTDGGALLMELEAIEPHLFPQFGPKVADMLAASVAALLDR